MGGMYAGLPKMGTIKKRCFKILFFGYYSFENSNFI